MTESSSKPIERSLDQDNAEVSLLREQVKLLESEMESLWRRIKILEMRAGTASQNLAKNDAAAISDSINKKYEKPDLPQASRPNAAIGKRVERSRRRRRARKIKRRLLFFCLLLVGTGMFVMLVMMIFNPNPAGTNPVLGGDSSTNFIGEGSDSAEVNIEPGDKADLEELRRAIESADE